MKSMQLRAAIGLHVHQHLYHRMHWESRQLLGNAVIVGARLLYLPRLRCINEDTQVVIEGRFWTRSSMGAAILDFSDNPKIKKIQIKKLMFEYRKSIHIGFSKWILNLLLTYFKNSVQLVSPYCDRSVVFAVPSSSMLVLQSLVVSLVYWHTSITATRRWLASQAISCMDNFNLWWMLHTRLVWSRQKSDHITPLHHDLHWLWVLQWIEFKLAVMVFRCQHGMVLLYLTRELCHVVDMDSRRRLRSASTFEVDIPPTYHRQWPHLRSCCSSRLEQSIPSDVITSPSLPTFKRRLKILLFACLHIWLMTSNLLNTDILFFMYSDLGVFLWLYGTIVIFVYNNNNNNNNNKERTAVPLTVPRRAHAPHLWTKLMSARRSRGTRSHYFSRNVKILCTTTAS